MPPRTSDRGSLRRSPRISGRSETPDARIAAVPTTPSRRALSPDLIEQMTPPAGASFRAPRGFPNLQSYASGSASINIKQEDASSSFYVREPSLQNRVTSPPLYQSALLRGDQRSFNDAHDVNNSHSASLSIFSSGTSDITDYQQEEREMAQLQNNPNGRETAAGIRRTSGQRKGRTSLDDRAYRPGSDIEEDDDDLGSPLRRRRKGRNSGSITAFNQGRVDNATWMSKNSKKGRGRKSGGSVQPGDSDDDVERDDSMLDHGEDDAGAASGKETRFDETSDTDDEPLLDHAQAPLTRKRAEVPVPRPQQPPIWSRVASTVVSLLIAIVTSIFRAIVAVLGNVFSQPVVRNLFAVVAGILVAAIAGHLLANSHYGLPGILPSSPSLAQPYPSDPDVPGRSYHLDRENIRLRTEINSLTERLNTLSSSIESHISSQLASASAKIQAEAEARKEAELSRLTANTKRQISRMAQEELKSIQETVSNSVEIMLRDLDKKVHNQLKQRADDTEDRFFGQLEKEIQKISKYANEEVNARLKQSFDQTFLSDLIEDKLERYSRDRTGKVDHAAVTSGAWVREDGTVHKGFRYNSVWNVKAFLAQGRKVPIGEPVKAITPGAALGQDNCWMTGWNSMLQVQLAETKVVDEVVLEHPLPGMTRTAPRRVIVWGLVDESDRQYYTQYRRSKATTEEEYLKQLLPEPFYNAVPQTYKQQAPMVLAYFEFKATGSTLQTFNTTQEARYYPHGVEAVRWQFIDGWAKSPPICVHRVRVHGSDWPVFGEKQDEMDRKKSVG